MSRAFVKESDGQELDRELPELRVSEHRNFVTQRGLELIETEARRLSDAIVEARAAGDEAEVARHSRDLRYWSSRRTSAVVVPPSVDLDTVRFGSRVALERADGQLVKYRIVGEDEAAPAAGTISYVSPLGSALLGRDVGDEIRVGSETLLIQQIGD